MIFKASLVSATTTAPVYLLLMFPFTLEIYDLFGQLFSGVFILSLVWVACFIISFLCLLPLCIAFEFSSRLFSIILFSLTGYLLPVFAQLAWLSIGFHGQPAPLHTIEPINIFIGTSIFGLIGIAGAISAWLCLHFSKAPNKLNQPGTPQSGAPV